MENGILKIAHLSDTHFCKSYCGSNMESAFAKGSDPSLKLRTLLQKTVKEKADCLIISGDIVHEGCEEDYSCFREMVEEIIGDRMKVLYVCGNHDRKVPFKKGLHMNCQTESIYYAEYVNSYRIVVLDSAVEGKETGAISREQEEWLRDLLKVNYGQGTLITFHHPIVWDMPQLAMPVSPELMDILTHSDVIGIFCGHTHSNNVTSFQGISQYTADAMAFGMDMEGDMLRFVEKGGMSFYQIQGKTVSTHVEPLYEKVKVLSQIPFQELLKLMN